MEVYLVIECWGNDEDHAENVVDVAASEDVAKRVIAKRMRKIKAEWGSRVLEEDCGLHRQVYGGFEHIAWLIQSRKVVE